MACTSERRPPTSYVKETSGMRARTQLGNQIAASSGTRVRQGQVRHRATRAAWKRRRPHLESLEGRILLAAGDLDPTFGTGGIATTDNNSYGVAVYGLALQGDGKIVAVGGGGFALARYNLDGSLDPTFGSGGTVFAILIPGDSQESARSVALQSDGKIVVAGFTLGTRGNDFLLARYNTDGTLDQSFGAGGIVTTDFGSAGQAS